MILIFSYKLTNNGHIGWTEASSVIILGKIKEQITNISVKVCWNEPAECWKYETKVFYFSDTEPIFEKKFLSALKEKVSILTAQESNKEVWME